MSAPPKLPVAPRPAAPTMNKLPARAASTLPGIMATASPSPAPPPPAARATMPGHAQVAAPAARPAPAASTHLGHAATLVATAPTPPAAAPGATSLATVSTTPPRPAQNVPAVDVDVTVEQAGASDKKRRATVIAAGAAVGVVIALVVGLRGGRHTTPVAPPAVAVAVPSPPPVVAPTAPAPPAAEPIAEVAPAPPAAKPKPHPKGRRLAREADAPRAEPRHPIRKLALASAKKEKPAAGDREAARAAYERGNTLLFAGDAGGAASAYREAVRLAPGDPVGYRGLGLASEKEGKTSEAITAFVSYLKLSRHAHDREVIARRLSRLTHARK